MERNSEFSNRDLDRQATASAAGTFFDKEHFGEDRLVEGNPHLPGFFAKAPLSDAARKDLIRLHGKNPDYMAGMSQSSRTSRQLARISYQDYLLNIAKMSPDALPFFLGQGGRNNKRVDTTPALEAARARLARLRRARPRLGGRRSARALTRSISPTATPRSHGCWWAS